METPSVSFETPRLLIREWEYSDIAELIDIANDPEFHFSGLAPGEQGAIEFVNKAKERRQAITSTGKRASFRLAIILKETNKLIGYIGAGMFIPDPQLEKHGYELAYFIAANQSGRGYATEAAEALLIYLKKHHEILNFYATAASDNLPAIAILHRLGFIMEHRFDNEYLEHFHGSDRQLFTLTY